MWKKIVLVWLFLVAAVKRILTEIWSVFSDVEKNADPWKISALAVLALCVAGGVYIFVNAEKLPTDKMGILSGLIGTGITIATFLFNQSRKSDAALLVNRSIFNGTSQ